MDITHAIQYPFFIIDCLIIKEQVKFGSEDLLKVVYFGLTYLFFNLYLKVAHNIVVYPVLDWVSFESYTFMITMLFAMVIGALVTLLLRVGASKL